MGKLIALVVVALALLGGLAILVRILEKRKPAGRNGSSVPVTHRYVPQSRVMTENEAAFYRLLRTTFGDSYFIFAQLPLSVVISPAKADRSTYSAAMNKIDRKTVDFALVDPNSLVVSAVIELNDASHNRPDRRERDRFVNEALAQAGVRIFTIPAAQTYNAKSLQPLIRGTSA